MPRLQATRGIICGSGDNTALQQISALITKQHRQAMSMLSDMRAQMALFQKTLAALQLEAELKAIKEQLAACRLTSTSSMPASPAGRTGAATASPAGRTGAATASPAGTTGAAVDNDLFDEDEDGDDVVMTLAGAGFPTLAVAGSNDTPQAEVLELPISLLYLNIKLNQNTLPSFPTGAPARKKKMYVGSVVLIFDLFATDTELDSVRQVRGYKNRTGDHRACAVEVIDASVRLFFATLFLDATGKVPPSLTKKSGGAVPALKLSTIHTLFDRLEKDTSLRLHGANRREALREALASSSQRQHSV